LEEPSVVFVDVAERAEVGGEIVDGDADASESTSQNIRGEVRCGEPSARGDDGPAVAVGVGSRRPPILVLARNVVASRDVIERVSCPWLTSIGE
jgi:hypothetical protein